MIKVEKLSKIFKIQLHSGGFLGFIKGIFNPKYKTVRAVDNISFSVEEGELVGFIGPNGAGKSTTLKMLSGILYPDSGTISVLGRDPIKERKTLAYQIGTVFGQKPQLWFHLPAIDSFRLFAKIYELDDKTFAARLKYLTEKFDLKDIIDQPVRKMSLGQRMKCEIALALIHNPKVLFLDEPTIGLDIMAKRSIRELIKELNEKENITVILTSHDMIDIEKICKRVIIINHGKIIYEGSIKELKRRYIQKRTIKLLSDDELDIKKERGIKIIKKSRYAAKIEINTQKVSLKKFTSKVMTRNNIIDITIEEPPIEEIIENIYIND